MRTVNYLAALCIVLFAFASCRPIEHLSPVPYIEFTSFTIFDTTDILGNEAKGGRLKFYFEDGDGNLGSKDPSGTQLDTTNLFFTLYRKTNGEIALAPANDPLKPSSYRIPYMVRLGQNKILKGTIAVTFLYNFYVPGDTILYDFYLKDRDLNESNVARTSEIAVSDNDTYSN